VCEERPYTTTTTSSSFLITFVSSV
jgi:hypothetical protein